MDEQMIRQWWDVFKNNSELTEIRILDGKKTYSGYYKNIDNLLRDIRPHENDNIYFTLEKTEKLTVLQTLQQKLGLKPSQIAIVEDTVKTLDYIRAHSDFVTVHVSSFME